MESPAVPVHLRSWMCAVGGIARAADVGEPVHTLLDRVADEPRRLQMTGSFGCFVGRPVVYLEEQVDHISKLRRRRRIRRTGSRAVGRGAA